jgi:GAF domain-containing protein
MRHWLSHYAQLNPLICQHLHTPAQSQTLAVCRPVWARLPDTLNGPPLRTRRRRSYRARNPAGAVVLWLRERGVQVAQELVVEDAKQHSLVCDNLAIEDLNVIAYAGAPIVTSSGKVLGAICMIDHQPRVWTQDELDILRDMAISVSTTLDLRQTILDLEASLKREESLKQQVTELQIVINESKRQSEVDEIVNTEFFEMISRKSKEMRMCESNIAKPAEE